MQTSTGVLAACLGEQAERRGFMAREIVSSAMIRVTAVRVETRAAWVGRLLCAFATRPPGSALERVPGPACQRSASPALRTATNLIN
jgi:hypothetical protein